MFFIFDSMGAKDYAAPCAYSIFTRSFVISTLFNLQSVCTYSESGDICPVVVPKHVI